MEHVFYWKHLVKFVIVIAWASYMMYSFGKSRKDKLLHCGISAFLTIMTIHIFRYFHGMWWIGPILVLSIGFGKEIADRLNKKKRLFDWHDIVADSVGVAMPVLCYIFW